MCAIKPCQYNKNRMIRIRITILVSNLYTFKFIYKHLEVLIKIFELGFVKYDACLGTEQFLNKIEFCLNTFPIFKMYLYLKNDASMNA